MKPVNPGDESLIVRDTVEPEYRQLPNPVPSEMEARDMVDPDTGQDMGGNPFQEGIMGDIDGGWKPLQKRDEFFSHWQSDRNKIDLPYYAQQSTEDAERTLRKPTRVAFVQALLPLARQAIPSLMGSALGGGIAEGGMPGMPSGPEDAISQIPGVGQITDAIGLTGEEEAPQQPKPIVPARPAEMLARQGKEEFEHPDSNPDFPGQHENDPETVDTKEFNDGEQQERGAIDVSEGQEGGDSAVGAGEPSEESFGTSFEEHPEVIEQFAALAPRLLDVIDSGQDGIDDPDIAAFHQQLLDIDPNYLENRDPAKDQEAIELLRGLIHENHTANVNNYQNAFGPNQTVTPGPELAQPGDQTPSSNPMGQSNCPYCGGMVHQGSGTCPQCGANVFGTNGVAQDAPHYNGDGPRPPALGAATPYYERLNYERQRKNFAESDMPLEQFEQGVDEALASPYGESMWDQENNEAYRDVWGPQPHDRNEQGVELWERPVQEWRQNRKFDQHMKDRFGNKIAAGPRTREQYREVAQMLIDEGRVEDIPALMENPDDFSDELASIQNNPNAVEEPAMQESPQQPAQPGPSMPGGPMPPPGGPEGGPMPPPGGPTGPGPMPGGGTPGPGAPMPGQPGGHMPPFNPETGNKLAPPGIDQMMSSALEKYAVDTAAPVCPKCNSHSTGMIGEEGACECQACGNQWEVEVTKMTDGIQRDANLPPEYQQLVDEQEFDQWGEEEVADPFSAVAVPPGRVPANPHQRMPAAPEVALPENEEFTPYPYHHGEPRNPYRPSAKEVRVSIPVEHLIDSSWKDEGGLPIREGQTYQMNAESYSTPDFIRVNTIKPDALSVTILGGANIQTEITKEEADAQGNSFTPVEASDIVDAQPEVRTDDDLASQQKRFDEGQTSELRDKPADMPDYSAKVAGRSYNAFEQSEYIEEKGSARNLDKLDLRNTHYDDDVLESSYDENFLWL